jgi:integrase/recombinase XerD
MTINQLTLNAGSYYAISIPVWDERVADIRCFKGRRWDAERKVWLLPVTPESTVFIDFLTKHRLVKEAFVPPRKSAPQPKPAVATELPSLPEEKRAKVNEFEHYLKAKRFSSSTIKTYCDALRIFLRFFAEKPIEQIDNQDVIHFNVQYILVNNYSSTYQNQVVNAIKKFFYKIENRALDLEAIERPKKEFRLPEVLSLEEIERILNALSNVKHRTMLALIYSVGLRRNELLSLRIKDIDSTRMVIHISNSKGKKDRIVPLSPTTLELLRHYYKAHRPKDYLFEGQFGGKYSAKSLHQVFQSAKRLANIKKNITLHTLRHSYATHLMESGVNLRYIQEILGHKSPKTTQIYTHVSTNAVRRVTSPIEQLNININQK